MTTMIWLWLLVDYCRSLYGPRYVYVVGLLHSASSSDLMVSRTIRSIIGVQSAATAASTWNALPRSVRSSTSV